MLESSSDPTISREEFVAWYFKTTANMARMSPEERGHVCSFVLKHMYKLTLNLIEQRDAKGAAT
jgi:hypothetical protein